MEQKQPGDSGDDKQIAYWSALRAVDLRVSSLERAMQQIKDEMRDIVTDAVRQSMPTATLSDDEHHWVRLAIQREAQMIAFRRAVIEKSLIGLVWAGIIAVGIVAREYAIAHGMWRP